MNAIKEKRLALGLSQRALAKAVGVGQASITRWELDKCNPTADAGRKLCAFFQCTPEELNIKLAENPQHQANQERAREYVERRLTLGLTQKMLAERACISLRTVQALERGERQPRWDTMQKIRRVLGMLDERCCTEEERNILFLEMQDSITWIVRKNRHRIQAVHMDLEDVWQDLAVCALRAIDRFRPDGGAALKTFVECNMNFLLEKLLVKFCMHGLSGRLRYPLPDIRVSSLDAMLEAGYQAEEQADWDEAFAYGHEENRPW